MNGHDENDENLQAPDRLVEALRATHNQRLLVPASVDEGISVAARRHLAAKAQQRRKRPIAFWAAMAAGIMLLAFLGNLALRSTRTFAPGDINHDGRVDILDAFALARELEHQSANVRDMNRDGVVDQKDVVEIARSAVRLDKGGGS